MQRFHLVYKSDVKVVIMEHRNRITEHKNWLITGPVCLAIVLGMATSNFHDVWVISYAWFSAAFTIIAAGTGIYTVCDFFISRRRENRPMTVDELVERCLAPPP
jgi:uncharacterized membrane protein YczE